MTRECVEQTVSDILDNRDILGLKYKSYFNFVDIKTVFKENDGAILLSFFADNYKEATVLKIKLDSCEEDDIINWAKRIALEVEAIHKINTASNKAHSDFKVEYRWSEKDKSGIAEWDYNSIEISLSKEAINMLVHYFEDENNIDEDVKSDDNDISSYIKNIDNVKIHDYMGVKLSDRINEALTENMLAPDEIYDFVSENDKGKKSLRCLVNIDSLNIIAVVNIEVSYKNKDISISIDENKVLDTKEFKIIKVADLCSGICSIMHTNICNLLKWV